MNIELRLVQNGVEVGPLPDVQSLDLSPVFCDYGTISFSYPKNGVRFDQMYEKDEIEVVPYINGEQQVRFGGLLQEQDGDDVAEAGIFKFTGLGYLVLLDEGLVYPYNWPNVDPKNPSWKFPNASAGVIMKTLIQEAQIRGALPGITTTSFTNTTDSNGQAWAMQTSIEAKPGATVTGVLKSLYEQGMIEFEMVGRDLRIYNKDTLSVDRSAGPNAVTFRKGRDLRDSPRKSSSRGVATTMLGAGKDDTGMYVEQVDPVAIAARRRIEGYTSNGNVSDQGTLIAFTNFTLLSTNKAKMEKTHGLEFVDPDSPQPIKNFDVGDWCLSDVGRGNERLRVKQWVLSQASDGSISGSVTLNDMFAEFEERLAKRIAGIAGGSTISGESRATETVPDQLIDGLAPKTPTGLQLSSDAYVDNQGQTFAQISASWLQVVQNSDNTALEDLGGYQIRWRYTAAQPTPAPVTFDESQADDPAYMDYWNGLLADGWTGRADDNAERLYPPGSVELAWKIVPAHMETFVSWSPLTPNVQVEVEVMAFDKSGNGSAWSPAGTFIQTGYDTTPPPVPSTPVADNYLGLFRVQWDGKGVGGVGMGPDYKFVEVHVSSVDNFTPSASTLVSELTAAGSAFAEGAYGTLGYAKLVSVDHTGNKSAPSAQASATPQQVVSADILDGAVGSLKLADLAVVNAKIGLLAVNDANIGSLNVGKLVAGTLSAQVTITGRITTALTGQRTEMNSLGFFRYDGINTSPTVAIDSNGALITGTYRTAVSGRRLQMGTLSNSLSQLDFWAPNGDRTYLRAFTESGGLEAIQLGVGDPTQNGLDNRININSTSWLTSRFRRTDFVAGESFNVFSAFDAVGTQMLGFDAASRNVTFHSGKFLIQQEPAPGVPIQFVFEKRGDFGVNYYNAYFSGFWKFTEATQAWTTSPKLNLFTSEGYGAYMRFNGGNGWSEMEFKWFDDSFYITLRAANYLVPSDAGMKENIADADVDFLAQINATKVKKYRRTKVDKEDNVHTGGLEIGLIAQEAPAQIVTGEEGDLAVDLYQMNSFIWGAVQQLSERLDALDKNGVKK